MFFFFELFLGSSIRLLFEWPLQKKQHVFFFYQGLIVKQIQRSILSNGIWRTGFCFLNSMQMIQPWQFCKRDLFWDGSLSLPICPRKKNSQTIRHRWYQAGSKSNPRLPNTLWVGVWTHKHLVRRPLGGPKYLLTRYLEDFGRLGIGETRLWRRIFQGQIYN